MIDYTEQADLFAKKHEVELEILSSRFGPYFDKEDSRWIFTCVLKRNGHQYTFDFGQSIAAGSEKPDMYSVLSCLEKYDHETFENFCDEYGYDKDSRKAEKIFRACKKEFNAVTKLFGDIMDELYEIQ